MRIHSRSKEKNASYADVYIRAGLFGCLVALFVIGGGKGIKFIVKLIIEYWLWTIGLIFVLILLRRFILKWRQA